MAWKAVFCYSIAMSLNDRISPGANVPHEINVIVEIPKGSQNKYEYDEEHHLVKLDRVLHSPLYYPGEYGFIPQTLGKDGDPMDALVLVNFPTYPGVLIECRVIGMLEMIDQGEADDKILCVPVNDIRYGHVKNVNDIRDPVLNEIAHFFRTYKDLEGKKVEIAGWKSKEEAYEIINLSLKRYKKQGQ
jgi:inorganic pyrophosphatase